MNNKTEALNADTFDATSNNANEPKKVSDKGPVPSSKEVRQVANSFFEMRKAGRIKVADDNVENGSESKVAEKLSEDQANQITALAKEQGLSFDDVQAKLKERYGKVLHELTQDEGAEFLNELMPNENGESLPEEAPF